MDWDDIVDGKILGPLMAQFGTAITYMPVDGGSFQITGAYDKAFFGVDPVTGSTVVTQQPTVGIQVSQFPIEPQQYDTLMINKTGEQWQVREVHLDGHGGGRLMLNVPGQTDA
ncbi:hypothetical protein AWB77_04786 [Caballeronia fortuita]|uniref:Bacteriophage protein n=1 Tax=Caballeronia fortuita TaxID=1777138 RepID=A0A158D2K8_9BURK|nr:hypothetical protein [Caballeronia fortuita]SAK88466.1 hypothetical protein AWB77_04786 [Caballeronia fortuita]